MPEFLKTIRFVIIFKMGQSITLGINNRYKKEITICLTSISPREKRYQFFTIYYYCEKCESLKNCEIENGNEE